MGEPHLYLVIDCAHPAAPPERIALGDLGDVHVGRGDRRELHRVDRALHVQLADDFMSANHARFTLADRWHVEDAGSKNGTHVNGIQVDRRVLADGDIVELGHTLFVFRADVERRDGGTDQLLDGAPGLRTIVADVARVFPEVARAAASGASVVLHGEVGTGEELFARTIHELSPRAEHPYVAVACATLPPATAESELFGSAADHRAGLVRHADGGTLFVDAIGELAPAAQAGLVRLLGERAIRPAGGDAIIPVDIRVVVATHQELPALVEAGKLRAELAELLAGATIELPPLRERREDLGILVGALLRNPPVPAIATKAARCLLRYPWPANLRELEKTLERAVVLSRGRTIGPEHLPDPIRHAPEPTVAEAPDRAGLEALLREHHGNVSAIARRLGKAPVQIRRWLKRYNLVADTFRDER